MQLNRKAREAREENPKDLKGSGGMSPVGANTIRDRRPRTNPSVSSPFALFASFAVKNPGAAKNPQTAGPWHLGIFGRG